ncbi:unconventional myosin-Ia-like isoform X2 [Amphibalanus amphitrite]|uniref:unconventional myosin-Ia-like isoform X2 n=1 Tax=Amphibalanus amphitrite TaxID=1232801 RepID=UPI001C91060E|nr:unconventional myosin-Ia-like isoform X2 [Amphibalanus amphitrite]
MASGGPGPPLGERLGPRSCSGERLGPRSCSGDRLAPRSCSGDRDRDRDRDRERERAGTRSAPAPGRPLTLEREVGVWDTVLLEPLTEQAFIANLHQRYKHDQIYTYISQVLVSVNPYKKLPLYSSDVIRAYRSCSRFELPPHVYAVAEEAYRAVREHNSDQCVVISGESGAGKTEASKLIMQYVAAVSGRAKEVNAIKGQLLQSNPVLEAFGNAKTHRNDNSSRFGKYMDLEFDFKGDPIGGLITNYLLEKSRVTAQQPCERNFHIFYQLLTGADIQLLKSLKLQRNVENYDILKQGRPLQYETLDDKRDFQVTRRAMDILGLTADEQQAILRVIASVLKLGNVTFSPVNNIDGSEGCVVDNEYEVLGTSDLLLVSFETLRSALTQRLVTALASDCGSSVACSPVTLPSSAAIYTDLQDACELLHTDTASLQASLTSHTLDGRLDAVTVELSAAEACSARDVLARALYSRLFAWIVMRINETIKPKKHAKRKVLGVLDIYGFEVFERNGFEQFCINFCNEKLQQIFIQLVLREEQEEYVREGIEWTPVDYFNNAVICDLIEKTNQGILSMLDDECLKPGHGSDEGFLSRLNAACSNHPHFSVISDNSSPAHCFRLKHYAGDVTYDVTDFVKKNVDALSRDLSLVMYRCDLPLMKALFPEGNPKRVTLRRGTSASAQFKISLGALMKSLAAKQPHYVRCVKPNDTKVANEFDSELVRHQVRYLNLLETVRVKRVGFAFRQSYESFLARYKMLSLHTWPSWCGLAAEGVTYLLRDLPSSMAEYAFGRTKLFIRSPETVYELEEYRRDRLEELATLIQKTWRGWRQHRLFEAMRKSQIIIASNWRTWKAKEELRAMKQRRRTEWAARLVQRAYRGWKRRRFLLRLAHHLPSESPLCREWPRAPPPCQHASALLYKLYHKWRCHKYRMRFDQTSRNRMREKVTSSIIFKGRKASYPKSIGHPFLGDYVRLRQNSQWKKMSAQSNDQYVVFADIINKIARSSGKFVPVLFVLSTSSMLILDQRTMQIKYRIPAPEIYRISLSPFLDDIAVFHVRAHSPTRETTVEEPNLPGCLMGGGDSGSKHRKGDLVFQTGHVIEIVTKLFLVIQNATGKPPDINIDTEFEANFGQSDVVFSFKASGHPDMPPGQIRIIRRANKMEVIL